jgi:hypothetical protein
MKGGFWTSFKFRSEEQSCTCKQSAIHPDEKRRTATYLQHAVHSTNEEEEEAEKEPVKFAKNCQAPESIERNKATNSSVNATTASNLLHG